jgi:hypothetical protein
MNALHLRPAGGIEEMRSVGNCGLNDYDAP